MTKSKLSIKKRGGGVVDSLGRTRFDEIYDWYKSIQAGDEESPEGGADYSTVEKRVEVLEDSLKSVKTTADNAADNALTAGVIAQNLQQWYDSFPLDNQTWGIMNRKPEIVAGEGEEVIVATSASAASLALQSLQSGVLITDGADEEMLNEMRIILGDKIFNELASNSIKTMELTPQLTIEEQIAQAKKDYNLRKEYEAEMAKSMAEQVLNAEEVQGEELPKISKKDIEPDKTV